MSEGKLTPAIVGAVVGAVVTGVVQFIILNWQHSENLEAARLETAREFLVEKHDRRQRAYQIIRGEVFKAINNPSDENIQSAIVSLRTGLPFFVPRTSTRLAVQESATGKMIDVLSRLKGGNGLNAREEAVSALEELEQKFQADLDSIEEEINSTG